MRADHSERNQPKVDFELTDVELQNVVAGSTTKPKRYDPYKSFKFRVTS